MQRVGKVWRCHGGADAGAGGDAGAMPSLMQDSAQSAGVPVAKRKAESTTLGIQYWYCTVLVRTRTRRERDNYTRRTYLYTVQRLVLFDVT